MNSTLAFFNEGESCMKLKPMQQNTTTSYRKAVHKFHQTNYFISHPHHQFAITLHICASDTGKHMTGLLCTDLVEGKKNKPRKHRKTTENSRRRTVIRLLSYGSTRIITRINVQLRKLAPPSSVDILAARLQTALSLGNRRIAPA
jgi:hypothetical protein